MEVERKRVGGQESEKECQEREKKSDTERLDNVMCIGECVSKTISRIARPLLGFKHYSVVKCSALLAIPQ